MIDVIILLVILALVVLAGAYIVKAKKKGQVCIGCPHDGKCGSHCHCKER